MNIQPNKAMEKGFTAQLIKSVTPMPRQCSLTRDKAVKSIFTSIGMIINQIRIATGKLTLAISTEPMLWNTVGKKCPNAIPTMMQKATQTVR